MMDDPAWVVIRGICRGLHLAGYFCAFGSIFLCAGLLQGEALRGIKALAWAGFAVALLFGLGWFLLQTADFASAQSFSDVWAAIPVVAEYTRFGNLVLGRLAVLLLAVLLFQVNWPRLAAVLAFGGVVAESWLGHGGAMTGWEGDVLLATSVPHLAAAALWLGVLPGMYMAVLRLPDAAPLLRRFSPLGMGCVGVLLVTAVVQYVLLIATPRAFFTTAYGAVAFFKILLLCGLIILAVRNRARLLPCMPASRPVLLRAIGAEMGLGLLVLAAAGLILQLEPPTMVGMM